MLAPGPGYERRLDMMLRLGPYGDAFGANTDGLTLERLKAAPHGIDFGALQPRLPGPLRTASGKVELAPAVIIAVVARLHASLADRGSSLTNVTLVRWPARRRIVGPGKVPS